MYIDKVRSESSPHLARSHCGGVAGDLGRLTDLQTRVAERLRAPTGDWMDLRTVVASAENRTGQDVLFACMDAWHGTGQRNERGKRKKKENVLASLSPGVVFFFADQLSFQLAFVLCSHTCVL